MSAGHIQDRWWRDAKGEDGKPILNAKGKPVKEKTELYGKGLRYKVRYYDDDNEEKNKSFADGQLGKAKNFLTKMQNDVLEGTYIDPGKGKIEFKEYCQTVLMGRSQDESTKRTNEARLDNQVYPFLGKKSLERFNADLIRKWLEWMNGQKNRPSEGYQKTIYDLVSSVLDAAVIDGRIRSNPCRTKSITRPAGRPAKVAPWPDTRMRKIELALPPRNKIVIPLGAGLGLRQGEAFAFSMDNVDREKMIYRCTRQLVYVGGVHKFKLPKGHKVREVPLGAGVLEDLDTYAENFPPVEITLPWAENDGRKFDTVKVLMTRADGGVDIAQSFNNRVWKRAFADAGLTYHEDASDGMHALRHLFASWMLQQGVSIKELAAFLGHSSEAFTLRTYVHLMPNSYDRARLAVNTMFRPRRPSSTKDRDAG